MNERDLQAKLTETVERLHAPLLLFARQIAGSEAEDLVQEAFLRLLREWKNSPNRIENIRAWLFRVVRNEAVSRLRRQKLFARHAEELQRTSPPWFESRHDSVFDVDDLAAQITRLPLELREILVARLWGELSFQEIGQLTETSQSTVFRRYHEALQLLKEFIEIKPHSVGTQ